MIILGNGRVRGQTEDLGLVMKIDAWARQYFPFGNGNDGFVNIGEERGIVRIEFSPADINMKKVREALDTLYRDVDYWAYQLCDEKGDKMTVMESRMAGSRRSHTVYLKRAVERSGKV